MNILVTGGTGTVGSQVVKELLARNQNVTVLTRSADKVNGLPSGVKGVVGDLLDPNTVRTAFKGMDAVFLINTVSASEPVEGLMGLNGARLAGLKKIVYMSVHKADKAMHLPHFGGKVAVELAIKQSGIPYVILRPNNFHQNDLWFKDAMLQYKVYPQPIGDVGVSRVDVRDIAEAAAICLTTSEHDNQTFNLVGPKALKGVHCARIWSKALAKRIKYAGNDLDAWEQEFIKYMSPLMVFDFKLMFQYFQEEGLKGAKKDIEKETALLGHPPRSLEDYAAEMAQQWK